jgi:hypothetical protein
MNACAGIPDCHTSAIKLLKDYVGGKLRFCHAPPGVADVALGPVDPADRRSAEDEKAGTNTKEDASDGASSHETIESGVAIGQTKKGRKSRANRGLSAGIFAEDIEADLIREAKQVRVFHCFSPCSSQHACWSCKYVRYLHSSKKLKCTQSHPLT